eukprot:2869026-Pleurochrysis_carterae.AAC.1
MSTAPSVLPGIPPFIVISACRPCPASSAPRSEPSSRVASRSRGRASSSRFRCVRCASSCARGCRWRPRGRGSEGSSSFVFVACSPRRPPRDRGRTRVGWVGDPLPSAVGRPRLRDEWGVPVASARAASTAARMYISALLATGKSTTITSRRIAPMSSGLASCRARRSLAARRSLSKTSSKSLTPFARGCRPPPRKPSARVPPGGSPVTDSVYPAPVTDSVPRLPPASAPSRA